MAHIFSNAEVLHDESVVAFFYITDNLESFYSWFVRSLEAIKFMPDNAKTAMLIEKGLNAF